MDELRERARRAYETTRLRSALPWALPALLLAKVAGSGAWPLGGVLAGVLVLLRWRGGELGRGVPVGLAAGTLVVGVVAGWVRFGPCCGDGCVTSCGVLCGLAGLAAAGLIGAHASSRPRVLAALGVASLAAVVSCLAVGLPGLLAVAGLWGATSPRLVWITAPQR
jgi:hypothetical protein